MKVIFSVNIKKEGEELYDSIDGKKSGTLKEVGISYATLTKDIQSQQNLNYVFVDNENMNYYGWYIKFLASKLNDWEQINSKMTIEEFIQYILNKS